MSKNIKNTCIRFNLSDPIHSKAWSYMQTMDKKKFISYSNVVSIAVAEYFDKYYKAKDDPYFETREREEKFIEDILSKVEKRLNDLLPQYMFANMMPNTQEMQTKHEQQPTPSQENEEIDWDLLESLNE